jgi:hypothetical protein
MDMYTDSGTLVNNEEIPPLVWAALKDKSRLKIGALYCDFKLITNCDDSGLSTHNSSDNEEEEEVPCSQEETQTEFRRTIRSTRSQSISSTESSKEAGIKSFNIPATQLPTAVDPSDTQDMDFYIPETQQEFEKSQVIQNMSVVNPVAKKEEDDDYFQFHTEDEPMSNYQVEQSQNLLGFMLDKSNEIVNPENEEEDDDELSKLEWNETTRKSNSLQVIASENNLTEKFEDGRESTTPEIFLTAQSTTSNQNDRNRILDTIMLESQDLNSQAICGKQLLGVITERAESTTPDLEFDIVKEVSFEVLGDVLVI